MATRGKIILGICPLQSPCRDCPERFLGCHSVCERYRAYKAELEAIYEERKKDFARKEVEFSRAAKIEAVKRGKRP